MGKETITDENELRSEWYSGFHVKVSRWGSARGKWSLVYEVSISTKITQSGETRTFAINDI